MQEPSRLHVMAAVIRDREGRILLSRRADRAEQGGLWEFPGGKLEPGESRLAGLTRELHEELGILLTHAAPLIRVPWDYPARRVLLDVFEVTRWSGEPHGREGQPLAWVEPADLERHAFPAANRPIALAAQLPRACCITPEPAADPGVWLQRLEHCLTAGVRLVQLRAPSLDEAAYTALARRALPLTRRYGARLLLNAAPGLVTALGADGVHLNGRRLRLWRERPLPRPYWVTAVCHDAEELELAQALGVDCLFISPVQSTDTHPAAATLGWTGLSRLANRAGLAGYALGGLDETALAPAVAAGCVGIASVSACWGRPQAFSESVLRERLSAVDWSQAAAL